MSTESKSSASRKIRYPNQTEQGETPQNVIHIERFLIFTLQATALFRLANFLHIASFTINDL